MFPLSAQNNFCSVLSSYVEGHMQKISSLNFYVFGWFPGLQNLDVFMEQFLWNYFGNHL